MRILALDQATKITGYSVWDNGKLIQYGDLREKGSKVNERIRNLYFSIEELIKQSKPDFVVLEDTQYRMNMNAYKILCQFQGVIFALCFKLNLGFYVVGASIWKSTFGIKSKKSADQKKETQQIVLDNYKISVGEDTADSIGIGYWATKNLKEKED